MKILITLTPKQIAVLDYEIRNNVGQATQEFSADNLADSTLHDVPEYLQIALPVVVQRIIAGAIDDIEFNGCKYTEFLYDDNEFYEGLILTDAFTEQYPDFDDYEEQEDFEDC